MRRRCEKPNFKQYKDYGGRGITVCDRWEKFEGFLADMGAAPHGLTIERRDHNGNYTPENCVWASRKQQGRNRRSNVIVEWNGVSKCIADWADHIGMDSRVLMHRLRRKWSVDRALTEPVGRDVIYIEYDGVVKPILQWSAELGISYHKMKKLFYRGYSSDVILGFTAYKQSSAP